MKDVWCRYKDCFSKCSPEPLTVLTVAIPHIQYLQNAHACEFFIYQSGIMIVLQLKKNNYCFFQCKQTDFNNGHLDAITDHLHSAETDQIMSSFYTFSSLSG